MEDWKKRYHDVKYMLDKYQDEVVPKLRADVERLEKELADAKSEASDSAALVNSYNAWLPLDAAVRYGRARRENRLWISPVALGQTVWGYNVLGEPHPFIVERIDPVNGWFCNLFRGEEDQVWMFEDIGKKVYLTKAEATAAKEAER